MRVLTFSVVVGTVRTRAGLALSLIALALALSCGRSRRTVDAPPVAGRGGAANLGGTTAEAGARDRGGASSGSSGSAGAAGASSCPPGQRPWMDDHGCTRCKRDSLEGEPCDPGCHQLNWNPCCSDDLVCLVREAGVICHVPDWADLGEDCTTGDHVCGADLFCGESGVCEPSWGRDVGQSCFLEQKDTPSVGYCKHELFCNESHVCEPLWSRGEGEYCVLTNWCAPDLFCSNGVQCTIPGTVTRTNSCCAQRGSSFACHREGDCPTGICVPTAAGPRCSSEPWEPGALGEYCPSSDTSLWGLIGTVPLCEEGLFCRDDACAPQLGLGEPCTTLAATACLEGTTCDHDSGVCVTAHEVGPGDYCDHLLTCPPGFGCNGRCNEVIDIPCDPAIVCPTGTFCSQGVCVWGPCW